MKRILFLSLMAMTGVCGANPMTQEELLGLIDSSHQAIEEQLQTPKVFVAVSLSMPQGSLLRLAQDAKDAGIALIVRGIPVEEKQVDKKQPTVKEKYGTHLLVKGMQAFEFLIKTGVTLQIDPRAFDVYGIQDVPQLIVSDRMVRDGASKPQFLRVRGDVTLAYGLRHLQEKMAQKAKTGVFSDFEKEANAHIEVLLRRLGGRE